MDRLSGKWILAFLLFALIHFPNGSIFNSAHAKSKESASQLPPEVASTGFLNCKDSQALDRELGRAVPGKKKILTTEGKAAEFFTEEGSIRSSLHMSYSERKIELGGLEPRGSGRKTKGEAANVYEIKDCSYSIPNACDPSTLSILQIEEKKRTSQAADDLVRFNIETDAEVAKLTDRSEKKKYLSSRRANKERLEGLILERTFGCACHYRSGESPDRPTAEKEVITCASSSSPEKESGLSLILGDVYKIAGSATFGYENISCNWIPTPTPVFFKSAVETQLRDTGLGRIYQQIFAKSPEDAEKWLGAVSVGVFGDKGQPIEVDNNWTAATKDYFIKHPDYKIKNGKSNQLSLRVILDKGVGIGWKRGNLSLSVTTTVPVNLEYRSHY